MFKFEFFGGVPAIILMWATGILSLLLIGISVWEYPDYINVLFAFGETIANMIVFFGAPSGAVDDMGVSVSAIHMAVSMLLIMASGAIGVPSNIIIGALFRVGIIHSAAIAVLVYLSDNYRNETTEALKSLKKFLIGHLEASGTPKEIETFMRIAHLEKVLVVLGLTFAITLVAATTMHFSQRIFKAIWPHSTWLTWSSSAFTILVVAGLMAASVVIVH